MLLGSIGLGYFNLRVPSITTFCFYRKYYFLMKTLQLVKYCMKNIYTLWAASKNKYSAHSTKLLMNESAMCITLPYS